MEFTRTPFFLLASSILLSNYWLNVFKENFLKLFNVWLLNTQSSERWKRVRKKRSREFDRNRAMTLICCKWKIVYINASIAFVDITFSSLRSSIYVLSKHTARNPNRWEKCSQKKNKKKKSSNKPTNESRKKVIYHYQIRLINENKFIILFSWRARRHRRRIDYSRC